MHESCLTAHESMKEMSIKKFYSDELNWVEKKNNGRFIQINFKPKDAKNITSCVPDQIIIFDYTPMKHIKAHKYLFTLFKVKDNTKQRAYQIEIRPRNRKASTHNGVVIYGPHEHLGDDVFQLDEGIDVDDFDTWLSIFCDKVKLDLTQTSVSKPF